MSKITERSCHIIDNEDSWSILWNQHKGLNGKEDIHCGNDDRVLPNIDFTKDMVVAVFMGECKTGGYKVFVTKVVEAGVNISVNVDLVYPNDLMLRPQVITYPFCIVKFSPDDLKKSIKFNIQETWEK